MAPQNSLAAPVSVGLPPAYCPCDNAPPYFTGARDISLADLRPFRISPLTTSASPEYLGSSICELSFTVNHLADGFPLGAVQDPWSWRNLLTGGPLLVPVEQLVRFLHASYQSAAHQDQDSAKQPNQAVWESPRHSVSFNVLGAHWAVDQRTHPAVVRPCHFTCLLCSSPDRPVDGTYGHIILLRPYPFVHQCQASLNPQLEQYLVSSDLEKYLIPKIT